MRVIGGQWRGTPLKPVPGMETRPTTDRVREAITSAVGSARAGGFEEACVLDAFAGSGAMGIEALSRGASFCLFFDKGRKAVQTIRANLALLGLDEGRAAVCQTDVFKAAKARVLTSRAGGPFDLVYMDPPYAFDPRTLCSFMQLLAEQGALAEGALLVYEYAADAFAFDESALATDSRFTLRTCKTYGTVGVSLMRYHGR